MTLASLIRQAGWDAALPACGQDDVDRMAESAATVAKALAAGTPIYGLTQGFGPLVEFAAESEAEQGASLIAHLGSGQGRPLDPDVCRLIVWLRLVSMRKGFSAVSPEFWHVLAELWNRGFTPAIPRDGTVSASGDLQPLAHAALAYTGHGDAWVRVEDEWTLRPAAEALAALSATPVEWPVREALAFVNGTGASLAATIVNQQSATRLVRAVTLLTARVADLLGANPEHYRPGIAIARGQPGQSTVARWVREQLPPGMSRNPARPLQEPYSLRCAPQVLGAVLDQLDSAGNVLLDEATGCTDNPLTHEGEVLHGGNFHAMPVGLASDQIGLALHQAAYLADRQLALICDPATNGGLPPMLTPRPGRGCGLAGVQISATSFVSRIRQLVYPASLTSLPTNGWNQDHVPMALNGANSVADALDLAWLVVGSLAVGAAQLAAMAGERTRARPWAALAEISPPLAADRPMAGEVRAARDLLADAAGQLFRP
ncbi:aromatic amino acid ammonia-lyase [Kibdelosporangium phytohabitans]|uniref:Histidine ammonia-lyase n=1 Tax=Kibdelosporangium phytohabitans TaxID=860235 RepID=A0A0N9I0V2_9PSEU|nr:aromatic amino acid ammonia-lyase [Kibdelosporangium phytohabitans]ALG09454.1 histidine ammonia-lyase [Kibdelosporangium phytohabitans]MBE1469258.1 histidine ammonia-lyase [Kibdelosporangium phytohabitans]